MKKIVLKQKNKSSRFNPSFSNKFLFCALVLLLVINIRGYSQSNDDKTLGIKESKYDTTVVETEQKLYFFIETPSGLIIDRIHLTTGEKKRILNLNGEADATYKKDSNRFKGHWSGIEVGINGLMGSNFSFNPPAGSEYFEMNMWRSWKVGLNFAKFSIPIIKNNFGIVTGLGIELNNYNFNNNNSIVLNQTTGVIEEYDVNALYDVKKSKLNTTSLTLPLLIEYQLKNSAGKTRMYISGGVIGGWNMLTTLKIKHEVAGDNEKLIQRSTDLKINNFRAGANLNIGLEDRKGSSSSFYARYYFTPFFEDNTGPVLYPFEIGFRADL